MRQKAVIALFIGFLLLLPTLLVAVSAQSMVDSVGEAFTSTFGSSTFSNLFERLTQGEASAIFWVKFMIWILLFSLMSYGLSFAFKESKKTANIVAGIVSLISILAIPKSILQTIFETYAVVISFVLLCVPIAAIIMLHIIVKKTFADKPRIAHLIGAVLSILLFVISMAVFG